MRLSVLLIIIFACCLGAPAEPGEMLAPISPKMIILARQYAAFLDSRDFSRTFRRQHGLSPVMKQRNELLQKSMSDLVIHDFQVGSIYARGDRDLSHMLMINYYVLFEVFAVASAGGESDEADLTIAATCRTLAAESMTKRRFQGWRVEQYKGPFCLDIPPDASDELVSTALHSFLRIRLKRAEDEMKAYDDAHPEKRPVQ